MKKYPNRTADRIMAPELQSSAKGGIQVVARQQVKRPPLPLICFSHAVAGLSLCYPAKPITAQLKWDAVLIWHALFSYKIKMGLLQLER